MSSRITDVPLPLQEAVRDLLHDLLSRACAVEKSGEPLDHHPDAAAVIVDYVDDAGHVAGTAIADIALAARAGSALVVMPQSVADDTIAGGHLDGDVLECFKEVAGVLGRLLNSPATPQIKVRGTYQTGDLLPGAVREMLRGEGCRRRDYVVGIEAYGEGRLALLARTGPD